MEPIADPPREALDRGTITIDSYLHEGQLTAWTYAGSGDTSRAWQPRR